MCLFVMRAKAESPEARTFRFERVREGHCDCDTVLGKDLLSVPKELQTETLRKKGWSDAKIKRAQEDRQKHAWTKQRGDRTTYEQDMAYWMKFIPETVEKDGWVGLLITSADNANSWTISRKQIAPLRELSPALLCALEKDVLYVFVNSH